MKGTIFFLLLLFVWTCAFSENNELQTQQTIKDITSHLSIMNSELEGIYQDQNNSSEDQHPRLPQLLQPEASRKYPEQVKSKNQKYQSTMEKVIGQLKKLSDEYKNNPYVEIVGFSINIGFPPSVTINVNFKSDQSKINIGSIKLQH